MTKMIALIKKLFGDKRIRFLFVGGINTCVGFGSYALFIALGVNPYLATTFSTIIGVINSYFWNKYFTFKQPKKSLSEVLRFASVYAVSYGANLGLVYLFVDRMGVNSYLSGVLCLFVTTILSYVGHNFFSFKKTAENESKT